MKSRLFTIIVFFCACTPSEPLTPGAEPHAAVTGALASCGPPPPPQPCETWVCSQGYGEWLSEALPEGTACLSGGHCDAAGHCVVPPTGPIPPVPADLQITSVTTHSLGLSWSPSQDASVYRLQVSTLTGQGLSRLIPTTSTSAVVDGLELAGYYCFWVGAYNANGGSVTPADQAVCGYTLPLINGRREVVIDRDDQQALFARAIGVPDTTVRIDDAVQLNMSGYQDLTIEHGVQLLGGRSTTSPGPLIFTTTRPHQFLVTGAYNQANGVRVSGIRLFGGQTDVSDDDNDKTTTGLSIYSSTDVEVDHNEIFGWSGRAVTVQDNDDSPRQRISLDNPTAVWVHDNFIHDNRHWNSDGYGVQTAHGAYAVIERNVFAFNRHALMGENEPGTGYLAYDNLVLPGGGEEGLGGVVLGHTHQLDVHGSWNDWLGRDHYKGPAGEYFEFRNNTVVYTEGDSLKVRGYPSRGAVAVHNVFAHSQDGAIEQTDGTNLYQTDNWFSRWPDSMLAGDFDGDGTLDVFMSTGVTWWFHTTTGWHFLQRNDLTLADGLGFHDFDADGRTDVYAGGSVIYSGGTARRLYTTTRPQGAIATPRAPSVYWQPAGGTNVVGWALAEGAVARELAVSPNQTRALDLLGSCDLNGDGSPDLVMRNSSGVVLALPLYPSGGVLTDLGGRTGAKGRMPAPARLAGTGDFNGDGRCDLLWRQGDGQLELWFGGEGGNRALVSHDNVVNAPSPTPLSWRVVGVGDFNGDGASDIALADDAGQVVLWYMNHGLRMGEQVAGVLDPTRQWAPQAVGDFDGDQHADLLWRDADGQLALWFRGLFDFGHATPTYLNQGFDTPLSWHVVGVLDTNADGLDDLVWRSDSGAAGVWTMNGGAYVGGSGSMATTAVRTDARSYALGQPIRLSWTGLTSSATNWVAYAPEGSAPTSVMRWSYLGGAPAGSLLLEGWLTPGRYVARTFIDDSYTVTAQSTSFVIH